jgi:glycosyltransferase involved in cell wall biosynthesis
VILGVEGQAQEILQQAGAGLLVEPENADALVSAINQLATNRELARELGEKGRVYILQKYSRSSTAQKYIEVLQRVISEG